MSINRGGADGDRVQTAVLLIRNYGAGDSLSTCETKSETGGEDAVGYSSVLLAEWGVSSCVWYYDARRRLSQLM